MKSTITKSVSFLVLFGILFMFSCTKESNLLPQEKEVIQKTIPKASTQELSFSSSTSEDGCFFPGVSDATTCSADGELPAELVAYGQCNEDLYEDFEPITFDGELYEYDGPADDATLAFAGVVFNFIITQPILVDPVILENRVVGGFWACLGQIIGVTDVKKLLQAYQKGRLTKKMVWKIVKRNLKRKLGPIGALISACEFFECLAS